MTMTRYEWITLALTIVFGLVGAWLFETFDEFGRWLANFCLIPPGTYYIYSIMKIKNADRE